MPFVEIRDLFKSYWMHGKRIDVLRGLSVEIERGELVSLVGASGAGKSTFLHVLGTLDAPAAGSMEIPARKTPAWRRSGTRGRERLSPCSKGSRKR